MGNAELPRNAARRLCGERTRDLAMLNLAIDSKLRACDLTALKANDVSMSGRVKSRAIVVQKKTGRPVQFEITEGATRYLGGSTESGFPTAVFDLIERGP